MEIIGLQLAGRPLTGSGKREPYFLSQQGRMSMARAKKFNPADNLPNPKPAKPPGETKSTRNHGAPWSKDDVK